MACKLGDVSPAFVHSAKRQLQRSPSAILLDSFFQMKTNEGNGDDDVEETLRYLSKVCEEMDSFDPKRIIDEEISDKFGTVSSSASTDDEGSRTSIPPPSPIYRGILAHGEMFCAQRTC